MSIQQDHGYTAIPELAPGKIVSRKCLRISRFAVDQP
jgi:hypothetical protein